MYKRIIFIIAIFFLFINIARSEQLGLLSTRGKSVGAADFVNTAFEPYGVGTGGVLTVFASTIESVFWNPAGLSEIESFQINMGGSKLSMDRYFTYLTAATPSGEDKAIGFTLLNSYNKDIGSYNESGTFLGNIKYMGNMFMFTYAKPMSIVKFGINVKVINEMIDKENSFGGGLDIGLKITPPLPIQVGILVKNLPGVMKYKDDDKLAIIDNVISVGIGYSSMDGDTSIGVDFYKEASDDIIYANLGGEFALNDFFRIRFGFFKGHFSAGTELYFGFTRINYTFYYDSFLDTNLSSNMMSVIWYF